MQQGPAPAERERTADRESLAADQIDLQTCGSVVELVGRAAPVVGIVRLKAKLADTEPHAYVPLGRRGGRCQNHGEKDCGQAGLPGSARFPLSTRWRATGWIEADVHGPRRSSVLKFKLWPQPPVSCKFRI